MKKEPNINTIKRKAKEYNRLDKAEQRIRLLCTIICELNKSKRLNDLSMKELKKVMEEQ